MDYLKEINEALKNVCKRAYQEGAQERDKIYNQGYEAGRHAAEEEASAADKDIETEAYNHSLAVADRIQQVFKSALRKPVLQFYNRDRSI